MAAIPAALDMTAESGSAAILDREQGAPLRGGQRHALPIAESRAEAAEHIRHFQALAGHRTRASGRHEVRCEWQGVE
jgi:hypothetical protein